MQKITRKVAGVVLHSDVLAIVDRLAEEQERSRSFIINQLLRLGFRQLQQNAAQASPVDSNSIPLKVVTPPTAKEITF